MKDARLRTTDAMTQPSAILLANGLYQTLYAKTSHGLIRGPSRYPIRAVVDPVASGQDAGTVLDGQHRSIPLVPSVQQAVELAPDVGVAIIGVATEGGHLPASLRQDLLAAARAGLHLINGLHQPLAEDPELALAAQLASVSITDFRLPKPTHSLRFFTGEIFKLPTPRVAILGTDCAVGKRTTTNLLHAALHARSLHAEVIFTGQTGWLQGYDHGFIFDATPNDFVSGELEGAILACEQAKRPKVMLIEGQSGLRNPSGPCGAELLLSAQASGAIVQHAPGRRHYEGLEAFGCEIPSIADEIELIERYGVKVWAVTLNDEGVKTAAHTAERLEHQLGIPVLLPLQDGVNRVAQTIVERLDL